MAAWAYAEEFVAPSEQVDAANARAGDLGVSPTGTGTGALLRVLAAATQARAVIEIGTGTAATSLWLLEGMPDDGVLTTIDVGPEVQRAARDAFAAAGITHQRTRVISGRAIEVLPRMADGAYDLLVVDGDHEDYPAYAEEAARLLRPGGTLAMTWSERASDPASRDPGTRALRDLARALRERADFTVTLVPVSEGVLLAVRT
jgi:predicted O-methyltransferase YrrM